MSEQTKKPNSVEVLKVEVKGENFAKAQLRCLDTGETSWHGFYRKRYKPKAGEDPRTDAEILVVPHAKLWISYLYQDGRAKNDGSGESWPGDYNIKDVSKADVKTESPATADDAREVFGNEAKTSEAPQRSAPTSDLTDRDKSIIAQVAWKCAAQLGAVHYNAVGEKDFDINVVGKWAREIAADIQSMSKDPFLWND